MQSLKRIGQPAYVASVVAFLAAGEARWITGDTIHADRRLSVGGAIGVEGA
jgi:NAD(P)-dependent dehydrogenase (short-subunit alcohol dehydrogenase family)